MRKIVQYNGEFFTVDNETMKVYGRHGEYKISIRSSYPSISTFRQRVSVHRLFAKAFVPNPNSLPCVNHKDENKMNYSPENLEWCTVYENNHYSRVWENAIQKTKTKIALRLPNETIMVFGGVNEAGRVLKIPAMSISKCIRGILTKTHGMKFLRMAEMIAAEGCAS